MQARFVVVAAAIVCGGCEWVAGIEDVTVAQDASTIGDTMQTDGSTPDAEADSGTKVDADGAFADTTVVADTTIVADTINPVDVSDVGCFTAPSLSGSGIGKACTSPGGATGGTIVDGTYVLKSADRGAPCPNPELEKMSIQFSAGTYALTRETTSSIVTSASGTYTTSGVNLELNQTCPSTASEIHGFTTATGDAGKPTLALFVAETGGTIKYVLSQ